MREHQHSHDHGHEHEHHHDHQHSSESEGSRCGRPRHIRTLTTADLTEIREIIGKAAISDSAKTDSGRDF